MTSNVKFERLDAVKTTSKLHRRLQASTFSASLIEVGSRLSVTRTTTASSDSSAFILTKTEGGGTLVTLIPPAPFAGTATYVEEEGVPTDWSGELSVPFLGADVQSLTGPSWTAQLAKFGSVGVAVRP
jgi:hypothetical protein